MTKHKRFSLGAAARRMALPLLSLSLAATPAWAAPKSARAKIYNADEQLVGTAVFSQQKHGKVKIQVKAFGLTPGFHGFHVHAVGECAAPPLATPFASAGGHFNPGAQTHKDHAGDLPVLLVNEDGTADVTFVTERFAVADLFDADGSALIIHASPDNYANIPPRYVVPDSATPDSMTLAAGDAGGRIACGVVVKK